MSMSLILPPPPSSAGVPRSCTRPARPDYLIALTVPKNAAIAAVTDLRKSIVFTAECDNWTVASILS